MDLKKKDKVGRFFFFFSNPTWEGFLFLFYFFQRFKNITQTSSILLFWQTNNTIVFTLSTGRIVHGTICLELNCTLKPTRTVFSLVAMLNFYFRFRLISHSSVCQNSSASVARLKTFKFYPSLYMYVCPSLIWFPFHSTTEVFP
jgi:hypothetical protein